MSLARRRNRYSYLVSWVDLEQKEKRKEIRRTHFFIVKFKIFGALFILLMVQKSIYRGAVVFFCFLCSKVNEKVQRNVFRCDKEFINCLGV